MASLAKDPGGKKRIIFTNPDGDRKTVYLGKMPLATARGIKHKIECLVIAKTSGQPVEQETAAWVRDLPNELADKLANVGLIPKRDTTTIGGLLDNFMTANAQAKPATKVVWGHVERNLKKHFGEKYPLRTIGRAEAESFRQFLIGEGLAPTTIHKRLQFARRFFNHAKDMEWIEKNPFKGVKHKSGDPQERQFYITPDAAERLIDAAPNWVWRTIIALSRYGGLRSPSEVLSLTWENVNWEHGSIKVTSPKTEGHRGGESRIIPIFAELRPQLEEAWEMAKVGQTHVIPEDLYLPAAQGPGGWVNSNLRTTFKKIVKRAGLEPWPRLFHNMRASCESDLAREYPITTVCKWIGNTVSIAAKHYIQVVDGDFQRAASSGKPTAQNTAQSMHDRACHNTTEGETNPKPEKDAKSRKVVTDNYLRPLAVPGRKSLYGKDLRKAEGMGLEPTTPERGTSFPVRPLAIRLPSGLSPILSSTLRLRYPYPGSVDDVGAAD